MFASRLLFVSLFVVIDGDFHLNPAQREIASDLVCGLQKDSQAEDGAIKERNDSGHALPLVVARPRRCRRSRSMEMR